MSGPGPDEASPNDSALLAFLAERIRRTAAEFGKDATGFEPPLLEWGERPELRLETADGRPRLFVSRHGHDWWQLRYQVAHEVFHLVCSPPRTFHWSHEALAVETAVRAMAELGEDEYVRRVVAGLEEESCRLTVGAMLTTPIDPGVDFPGLYGRAWTTCRALVEAAGWERVKLIAQSFDGAGRPDVAAWVLSLPVDERSAVERVLGRPADDWV